QAVARTLMLRDMNWLVPPPGPDGMRCAVQIRAREAARPATVWQADGNGARVELDEGAVPAPGQACVMYDGTRVLGGGFIRRAEAVQAGSEGKAAS
ncbi:aminomethyltransferase beta-barrel domain-containing protein, partial [Komagataeibacter europaeus]